jgi:hypothetical protein
MIHWEEVGYEWHRYVECSHWGLFCTGSFPFWRFMGMNRPHEIVGT